MVAAVSPQLTAFDVPFPDEQLLSQVYDDLDGAIESLEKEWWVEDAALISEWLEKLRTDTDGFTTNSKSSDALEFARYATWGIKSLLNDSIDAESRNADIWSPSRAMTFDDTFRNIRENVSRLVEVTQQLG